MCRRRFARNVGQHSSWFADSWRKFRFRFHRGKTKRAATHIGLLCSSTNNCIYGCKNYIVPLARYRLLSRAKSRIKIAHQASDGFCFLPLRHTREYKYTGKLFRFFFCCCSFPSLFLIGGLICDAQIKERNAYDLWKAGISSFAVCPHFIQPILVKTYNISEYYFAWSY